MTKEIELAEYLELLADIADEGRPKLKDDKRRIAAAELRRLAAVEQENAKLVKELAESKLHALNGWQRYEMANRMSNSLQQELAACKSRCNAAVGQADALRQELADMKAAMTVPFGYWFEGEKRFASLDEGCRYFDASEREQMLTPLYAIKAAK